jgi:prefoldin subunit 5
MADAMIATNRAADEIERLRERHQVLQVKVAELMAEINRLRAAKTPASTKLLNITKAALEDAEAECERLRAE